MLIGSALGAALSFTAMAQETQPVGPYKDFKGKISLDVRDSVADWAPYTAKKAPEGAPNFLFGLYDDTGLAAWSPYGGRHQHADARQARGERSHTIRSGTLPHSARPPARRCSPAAIITSTAWPSITEGSNGLPGGNGRLPQEAATVGAILQDGGWSTFWIWKNHNVPPEDVGSGASRKLWPLQKGFDRFYGFLGGETNQWYPDLVEDNHFIDAPYTPGAGLPPFQGPCRQGHRDAPRSKGY